MAQEGAYSTRRAGSAGVYPQVWSLLPRRPEVPRQIPLQPMVVG